MPLCAWGTVLHQLLSILWLQVDHKRFILGSGNLEGCPLTSHKAGRQAGGLHGPAWQPGVVGQGRGSVRVRAKNSPIKSYFSRQWSVPACTASFKSFLKNNKHESSFIGLLYVVGIDLEGWAVWIRERCHSSLSQNGQNSHPNWGLNYPSSPRVGRFVG